MSLGLEQPLNSRDSSERRTYTDVDFFSLDISDIVQRFVLQIDTLVDDLSYSVTDILMLQKRYGNRDISFDHNLKLLDRLADDLYSFHYVKNREDSIVIAEIMVRQLFPSIKTAVANLGFVIGAIERVSFRTSRSNSISCTALFSTIRSD